MIIDFHTHSFPDDIAVRAVGRLAQSGGIPNYLDGRVDSIKASMKKAGIDYSVLLPIATKPSQHTTINKIAIETNKSFKSTGIISFGTIHPDNDDYKTIISDLAKAGVPGIKLHPVFQRTNIDDPRCLRIIECANDNDLIVSIHCGMDISFPNCDEASVERLANMIKEVPPHKLVLAHMGGWSMYDEVCDQLIGTPNVWLDTALVLKRTPDNNFLSKEKFVQMVRTHGCDHILFGTDSPWSDQSESLHLLRTSGLTPDELTAIEGSNAATLLGSFLTNTPYPFFSFHKGNSTAHCPPRPARTGNEQAKSRTAPCRVALHYKRIVILPVFPPP